MRYFIVIKSAIVNSPFSRKKGEKPFDYIKIKSFDRYPLRMR